MTRPLHTHHATRSVIVSLASTGVICFGARRRAVGSRRTKGRAAFTKAANGHVGERTGSWVPLESKLVRALARNDSPCIINPTYTSYPPRGGHRGTAPLAD